MVTTHTETDGGKLTTRAVWDVPQQIKEREHKFRQFLWEEKESGSLADLDIRGGLIISFQCKLGNNTHAVGNCDI